ncbi:MAG: S8 family serine peptidase, partial [Wujia sp.]
MDENKISADLGLALDTEEYVREKSLDLNVGYIEEYDEWELLIKYSGDISELAERYNFVYTGLLANYAVIRVSEEKIEMLSSDNSVIYIEKPNYIYQEQLPNQHEYNISCFDTKGILDVQLNGEGIYVAVIDSGIDVFHDVFNDASGTKIKYIWDQATDGNPPMNYSFGTELNSDDINRIVKEKINYTGDLTGHGTGVAGIITELVPAAELLIVRLKTSGSGYSNSLNLIMAIDYVVKKALEKNAPLVINLSYGNNYGDHNSNSAIERFLNDVSGYGKITIATGMGNEGTAGRHSQLMLGNVSWARKEFIVNEFMSTFNLQIWKNYGDIIDIIIETPNGEQLGPIKDYIQNFSTNQELINSVNNPPTPFNQKQEIFIVWAPQNNYIQEGIWKVIFLPKVIIDGRVDLWLPTSDATSSNVKFITR